MTVLLPRVLRHNALSDMRLPEPLRRATMGLAPLLLTLCAATFAIDDILPTPQLFYITGKFFHAHDAFWLVALALFLIAVAKAPLPTAPFERVESGSSRARRTALLALALLVVVLGLAGAHDVLLDYPLSWDETLARFDSIIFRSGRTVAPLASEWRPYADALAWQSFMQPVADHAALVSAYLPVNAGLRALMGAFADDRLTSPLLAALAIVSAYGVGRRLWPEWRDAAFVAAILVLTSTQVLVTAMTPYAMTAHLAFNLLWLWLFLCDARIDHAAFERSRLNAKNVIAVNILRASREKLVPTFSQRALCHAGAILVGFLATGLHQLVFHPLFAAPFVLSLYRQRGIGLGLVYTLSYAGIGFFWISYWKIGLALASLGAPGALPGADAIGGARFFFERVAGLLIDYEWQSIPLMLKNGLRFVVWQNPLLLPLAALSAPALAQDRPHARELLAGALLTFAVMCLLMPFQGHGWGYRYLHGLIGNFALLAGFGWIAATRNATPRETAAMRAALFLSSAFSLLVLLPAHLESASALTAPYAHADAALRRAKSDIVVIDKTGMRYGVDFARNDPFLRERPIRLMLQPLSDADLAALCARYSIEVFDASSGAAFGVPLGEEELARRQPPRRPPCATPFEAK
ncbi:MAG: hypothetical protein WAK01_20215 [Methylocystis sp.]